MVDTTMDGIQDNMGERQTNIASTPPGYPSFRPIRFSGTTGEFFGIWIVNLILTMLTMGIYEAWAKVRVKKYFYFNTMIGEHDRLVYHATGGQIFVGRLIAFVVFVAISVLNQLLPITLVITVPLIILAMPYLLNRSLRFNARMTSWRNVRFDWHGTYWRTMLYFVLGPVISLLSLGLLMPLMSRYYYEYYAKYHTFGTTRFDASTRTGAFYWAFLMGLIIPVVVLLIIGFALLAITGQLTSGQDLQSGSGLALLQFVPIILILALSLVSVIYRAMCRNLLVQSLILGRDVEFDSSLRPLKWFFITLTNFLAVIFSLGLASPWAAIRSYRYLSENTHYNLLTDENQFVDTKTKEMSAFGQEFADFEGWEVSI